MNEAIDSLASTTFAGKRFNRRELVHIQQTVNDCHRLSRREVGRTVCEHLNWVTPGGQHRIQFCLNALEKMEAAGLFRLPEKQPRPTDAKQSAIQWSDHTARQPTIDGTLEQFTDIRVELATEPDAAARFNEYVDRYHYLGYRRPIGNHLRYWIIARAMAMAMAMAMAIGGSDACCLPSRSTRWAAATSGLAGMTSSGKNICRW